MHQISVSCSTVSTFIVGLGIPSACGSMHPDLSSPICRLRSANCFKQACDEHKGSLQAFILFQRLSLRGPSSTLQSSETQRGQDSRRQPRRSRRRRRPSPSSSSDSRISNGSRSSSSEEYPHGDTKDSREDAGATEIITKSVTTSVPRIPTRRSTLHEDAVESKGAVYGGDDSNSDANVGPMLLPTVASNAALGTSAEGTSYGKPGCRASLAPFWRRT